MIELVVESDAPIRLDRYLRILFPKITQSLIEKSLRNRDIRIQNLAQRPDAGTRVQNGDIILFYDGLLHQIDVVEAKRISSDNQELAAILKQNILFENNDLLVINKPSGVAVQGGNKILCSLDEALLSIDPEYRLTHRIDKDTSGVIIVAKTRRVATKITEAFAERVVEKQYLAILVGHPVSESGQITSYIFKGDLHKVVEDQERGKIAITDYEVVERQGHRVFVRFYPKTGRMHQLRHHALKIGCYIEGDIKYGPNLAQEQGVLKLHASRIFLTMSVLGYEVSVESMPVWWKRSK